MILNILAAAAESVSATDTTTVVEKWWIPLIGTIATILAALVTALVKKLVDKLIEKINATEVEKEAIQCVLEGMAVAQEEFVREAKKISSDGKLTKDEIVKAKQMAIDHAVAIAKGPAKDALIKMGSERIGSLIKQLLAKMGNSK